jgi:hypothetical protein
MLDPAISIDATRSDSGKHSVSESTQRNTVRAGHRRSLPATRAYMGTDEVDFSIDTDVKAAYKAVLS